ncbi:heavy-metal-associated domain-containing protein [Mycolicibacterium goodii]|uniref:Heavy-metal-associated domain-containing protein n=1 Tax=Mycolicibacterium goodii TaxID=134601 RepID=A0ABS6HJD3_MYCGD|nr:heavy-metal-associated domain-containing protein [Mycolicibacterium goodii]MBU8838850.1 heavy-metal-associated domain-containing protein [Mycolicibacterium goodii]
MTTTEYQVSGMTCSHCEQSVREEVVHVDGVQRVEVSATTGRLVVDTDGPANDEAIVAAVKEAGYEAVRSSGADDDPSNSTASSCGCR